MERIHVPRGLEGSSRPEALALTTSVLTTPLLALTLLAPGDVTAPAGTITPERTDAAELLLEAVDLSRSQREADLVGMAPLLAGAHSAADMLGTDSYTAALLSDFATEARWRALDRPSVATRWLERELRSVASDLTFQPTMQADLPEGFPGPTAVRELELKQYPTYRAARTSMEGESANGAFWELFQHIQTNDIAMTAPVEMSYTDTEDGPRESAMAFLYGDPRTGAPGSEGAVAIVDTEPMWVLSMGLRGRDTQQRITNTRSALEEWLAQSPDWRAAGELRVMGYNSPMVWGNRRFFEIQLPVERVLEAGPETTPQDQPRNNVPTASMPASESKILFRTNDIADWRPSNDTVMGGRSSSRILLTEDGTTLITGRVSLENNGGFASVRLNRLEAGLQGAQAVTLRVQGDGKTYQLRFSMPTDGYGGRISYTAPFKTQAGTQTEHTFTSMDFAPVWRGQDVPSAEPFDLQQATGLRILISDKQVGPFALELLGANYQ